MIAEVDQVLLAAIWAGGKRWHLLLARAMSAHLGRSLSAGDEAFEDTAGCLEDALLDALCAIRAVHAARGGRGDQAEALAEAGASLVRLSTDLTKLRCEALVEVKASA